ncbi:uncharacterized protein ASCRUDRAFT_7980 [Ascoidea rubescens DSM 1968]|uniref:Uncharacterized protein n=1 Tax=Ascoidea rubescens DSM 1968 TaxID=1344418 RepID=A0A1D2VHQ9_9ASCO|nr:hypothetical protein ASCRUDRAFT_7980 [Ascoidea rubescens DSM 1968]ODV61007.1 hypothetical protein ASCRUDRAFT_7980 [Ascoidea rubescens DSM 1968]
MVPTSLIDINNKYRSQLDSNDYNQILILNNNKSEIDFNLVSDGSTDNNDLSHDNDRDERYNVNNGNAFVERAKTDICNSSSASETSNNMNHTKINFVAGEDIKNNTTRKLSLKFEQTYIVLIGFHKNQINNNFSDDFLKQLAYMQYPIDIDHQNYKIRLSSNKTRKSITTDLILFYYISTILLLNGKFLRASIEDINKFGFSNLFRRIIIENFKINESLNLISFTPKIHMKTSDYFLLPKQNKKYQSSTADLDIRQQHTSSNSSPLNLSHSNKNNNIYSNRNNFN